MSPEKIKVAVIGAGWGAKVLLPVFRACPDIEVLAVCDERQERAEAAARQFNVQHTLTDYRRVLELEGLDIVSVAAPPFLHHPMVMAALDAGKHVLCEKPLAFDFKQACEMYHRAEELGLVHMIDFEGRFFPRTEEDEGTYR